MYNRKITAFIDILGFRNIVEKTKSDQDFAEKIYTVLKSMNSEFILSEIFGEVNKDVVPPEKYAEAKEIMDLISKAMIGESSIKVTHFSDSVVFSIGLENDMYAMSLFEYLGRLVFRLWKEFKILIRGAVTVDMLVHEEGGPLFGPAMVKAYDFETNLANYPRIILDHNCFLIIKNSPSYELMKKLFVSFSGSKLVGEKTIEILDGYEINLATAFDHIINSQLAVHPAKRLKIIEEIQSAIPNLEQIVLNESNDKIKEKYQYLINCIKSINYPKN